MDDLTPQISVGAPAPMPNGAPRGGLPAWTYDSEELTALETEHLFRRNWLIAGHVSEIPEPGDYMTFDAAGERSLTVRGHDGEVRSFHNLCRHRGSRVAEKPHGNCRHAMTCLFHGWSYGLDGRLRSIPAEDTFGGVDKTRLGLKPVEQQIWMGFVFVRFKTPDAPRAGDAPDIADIMAPAAAEIAAYKTADMVPLGPRFYCELDVNWKAMVDVDNEGYHVPVAHPSLNDLYGDEYQDTRLDDNIARSWGVFNNNPRLWSVRQYMKLLPEMTHLPELNRRAWFYIGVWPAAVLYLYPDRVGYYDFRPISARKGVIAGRSYGLPDDRRETGAARYLSDRIDAVTADEDIQLIKWSWEGMRSSAYDDFILSDLEINVRGYHDVLRRRLPILNLPEPPAPGTFAAVNAELLDRHLGS